MVVQRSLKWAFSTMFSESTMTIFLNYFQMSIRSLDELFYKLKQNLEVQIVQSTNNSSRMIVYNIDRVSLF